MKQKLMLVSVLALVLVLFSGCMINPSALMDKENDESSVTSIVNDAEDDQDEHIEDKDVIPYGFVDAVRDIHRDEVCPAGRSICLQG